MMNNYGHLVLITFGSIIRNCPHTPSTYDSVERSIPIIRMQTAINNSTENPTTLVKISRLIEVNLLVDHIGLTQVIRTLLIS